ncbi:late exocytosis, associated with Golgi transport-domain-containing protein, partial [Suillus tomentosus]
VIYEPKVKYHIGDKQPPRISDSLLGWLPPLIRMKEPELVDKLGLDAVTFLRFTRMTRSLYSAIAFTCCAILIPINVSYNLKNVPSTEQDALSILTIRDVKDSFLFAHAVASYVISALVMVFVWRHWKEMLRLQQQWFRSPEYMRSFYAWTLAVMHVPKKYQSDEGIHAIFASVQVPYPTTSVHIGRKVGRLPELIEYHNTAVRELEHRNQGR